MQIVHKVWSNFDTANLQFYEDKTTTNNFKSHDSKYNMDRGSGHISYFSISCKGKCTFKIAKENIGKKSVLITGHRMRISIIKLKNAIPFAKLPRQT